MNAAGIAIGYFWVMLEFQCFDCGSKVESSMVYTDEARSMTGGRKLCALCFSVRRSLRYESEHGKAFTSLGERNRIASLGIRVNPSLV